MSSGREKSPVKVGDQFGFRIEVMTEKQIHPRQQG